MLGFNEGSEELRKIVYSLSPKLKVTRDRKFIPHITLGRIGKELISEEFRNLNSAVEQLNVEVNEVLGRAQWNCNEIMAVKIDEATIIPVATYSMI